MYRTSKIDVSLQGELFNNYYNKATVEFSVGIGTSVERALSSLSLKAQTLTLSRLYDGTGYGMRINISQAGAQELRMSLEPIAEEFVAMYNSKTLDSLKSQVRINPSHIEYKDPKTGLQIVAATNGLSYLVTPRGVILQITPDAIKVKDFDGQIIEMDVSQMKHALKDLTDGISEEVKQWIQNQPASG